VSSHAGPAVCLNPLRPQQTLLFPPAVKNSLKFSFYIVNPRLALYDFVKYTVLFDFVSGQ